MSTCAPVCYATPYRVVSADKAECQLIIATFLAVFQNMGRANVRIDDCYQVR